MSDKARSRNSILVNAVLVAVILAVVGLCMLVGSGSGSSAEPSFVGTDSAAVASIEASGYQPWFGQVFAPPSAEVESGLFALQAALGAGVFGYALGALRRR